MRDNSFETFADKDDQAKITYEKYRQEAEELYLSATRRWKGYLLVFIALAVISFSTSFICLWPVLWHFSAVSQSFR